jgi:hypothetical protein
VSEETFDARMERLLRTLPPALRGMGCGDPDDVEYAHASDVVAWAIREIDRLREQRRWVSVGERLPERMQLVWVLSSLGAHVASLDSFGQWLDDDENPGKKITHWQPLPPGPEAANG